MLHRSRSIAVVIALVLAAQGLILSPVGVAAASEERVHLALAAAGEASDLVWSDRPGGVINAAPGASVEVEWDLTGLDRADYRSDLVRVEVMGLEGAARLTVHTSATHGREATVLDTATVPAADDPAMVVQLGRRTVQRWSVDRPGALVLELRASVPLARGGAAVAVTGVVIGEVGELSVASTAASGTAVDRDGVRAATLRAPDAAGPRVVISDGHVDIGPRIVDGRWRVQMKDDAATPHVWRDLGDVVLHAREASLVQVPDRPAYAFLGVPGTPYHLLPQTQQQGIVWPGWNSQDPSVIAAVPGSVTWRLRGVDGPGRFALFVTDSFGDTEVYFDTDDGMPQDLAIARNAHVHGNWAFGAPGIYRLSIEMRATLASGEEVADARILTVVVGDAIDPATVPIDDVGRPGQVVSPGGELAGPEDEVSITADLGGHTGLDGGGDRGVGGSLVRTGIDALPLAAWATGLLAVGTLLHLASRRRQSKNETHS